jgi:hypothetical protein
MAISYVILGAMWDTVLGESFAYNLCHNFCFHRYITIGLLLREAFTLFQRFQSSLLCICVVHGYPQV